MSAIKCATCGYLGESRLAKIHCHRCYKELEDKVKRLEELVKAKDELILLHAMGETPPKELQKELEK